jgi:hypothetical protein
MLIYLVRNWSSSKSSSISFIGKSIYKIGFYIIYVRKIYCNTCVQSKLFTPLQVHTCMRDRLVTPLAIGSLILDNTSFYTNNFPFVSSENVAENIKAGFQILNVTIRYLLILESECVSPHRGEIGVVGKLKFQTNDSYRM